MARGVGWERTGGKARQREANNGLTGMEGKVKARQGKASQVKARQVKSSQANLKGQSEQGWRREQVRKSAG